MRRENKETTIGNDLITIMRKRVQEEEVIVIVGGTRYK
jgi:hypothetical protein